MLSGTEMRVIPELLFWSARRIRGKPGMRFWQISILLQAISTLAKFLQKQRPHLLKQLPDCWEELSESAEFYRR